MGEVREFTLIVDREYFVACTESPNSKYLKPGQVIKVIAKADLQPLVDEILTYNLEDTPEQLMDAVSKFIKAWEGKNGTE